MTSIKNNHIYKI